MHHHSDWKRNHDAVYWEKLSRAQDQGLRFWQTKSRAIIVHIPVPADGIYRVISQKGDRKTLNPTTRAESDTQEQLAFATAAASFSRKPVSPVDKKPQFEIDLRVERVSQDAILQERRRTDERNQQQSWKS